MPTVFARYTFTGRAPMFLVASPSQPLSGSIETYAVDFTINSRAHGGRTGLWTQGLNGTGSALPALLATDHIAPGHVDGDDDDHQRKQHVERALARLKQHGGP